MAGLLVTELWACCCGTTHGHPAGLPDVNDFLVRDVEMNGVSMLKITSVYDSPSRALAYVAKIRNHMCLYLVMMEAAK